MDDHELGFTCFLAEPGRRRIRTLLELGPTRRRKVQALLDHQIRLDPRHASPLTGAAGSPDAIEAQLRRFGAGADCYLLSSSPTLDGRQMPLGEALAEVVGHGFGTFISCIAGRLGYFEDEGPDLRWLLRR